MLKDFPMNIDDKNKGEHPVFKNLKSRRIYASALMIPYLFVAYPLAGIIIGWWLDKKLKTSPWLLLVFLIAGMVEAIREMMRIAKRAEKEYDDETKNP
jgi:F0F1-type ATP synthase assembly protein I